MSKGEGKTKTMKLTLWDKLGRVFRGPVIGMGATVAATAAARFVAGPIIAASGASWAPTFATVVNTVILGGAGLQFLGILAVPAAAIGIAYGISKARNGKLYNRMRQKALLRKLARALKRGKDLALTDEQKQILKDALENQNKSVQKLINKIGRDNILNVIERGRTGKEKEKNEELEPEKEKEKEKEQEQEVEINKDPEKEPEPEKEKNEDLYAKIQRKSIFDMTLSARESLELQQIYNAEKKKYAKKVKELEAKYGENPTPEQQAEIAHAKEGLKKFTLLERRAFALAKKLVTNEMNDPNTNKDIPDVTKNIFIDFLEKGRRSKEAANLVTDNGRRKAEMAETNLTNIVNERKSRSSGGGR